MAKTATIDLLPKQSDAWDFWEDSTTTELGYGGAAGGGKTRLGWYLAITYAEMFPGSRGAVARKELKTLRLTSLAELFIIFNELGYNKDVDYNYNQQDGVIKFSNKSEILLLDTAKANDDPEYTRFGSLNLTWAWIEESNETPEKARDILNTRVGRHNRFVIKGKTVIAKDFWLETFNPNKGHVYRNYYKPWKEGKLAKHRQFIRALPGDNPYLPEAYITKLRNSPDKTIRERLLKGNFDYDADPNKTMNYDAILDLRTNSLVYEKHEPKFLINDIARMGGDKIVLGEFEGLTLTGLSVYTYQGTDATTKNIEDQADESKIPYSQILSDEDGIGGGVVDNLRGSKGFLGNSSPFKIMDPLSGKPINENFQNLRAQCYFKTSDLVNDHCMAIKLKYFKTNIEGYTEEQAIADLEEELDAIKKIDNSGEKTKFAIIPKSELKEALGRSPDFSDMFMMRTWFLLKGGVTTSKAEARKHKIIVRKNKTVHNRAM